MRKKPKAEPISVEDYDAGTAPLETDDTGIYTFVSIVFQVFLERIN